MSIEHLNPPALHANPAFSQAVRIPAGYDTLHIGGQNGVDGSGALVGPSVGEQTRQALANVRECLAAAGACPDDVVKWTILLTAGADLREGFGAFQQNWDARSEPPVITVAVVAALALPGALVELEAVAALPPRG
ncbi:RidA family protein [Pseudonocardia sp. CA-107938]|uniref:RidA family protein n=1 Tax=Pseudonocardia sp. CA-107938 TaxID=3240021 RepID=UPI003D8FF0DB